MSQRRRQKFARTFRKSSRKRGVFWVFRDLGVGFRVSYLDGWRPESFTNVVVLHEWHESNNDKNIQTFEHLSKACDIQVVHIMILTFLCFLCLAVDLVPYHFLGPQLATWRHGQVDKGSESDVRGSRDSLLPKRRILRHQSMTYFWRFPMEPFYVTRISRRRSGSKNFCQALETLEK